MLLVLAVIAALAAFVGALLTTRVDGVSMTPALQDGDLLLVDKVGVRFQAPARGDVVTVLEPNGVVAVKRVVGVPGDALEIDSVRLGAGDPRPHPVVLLRPGGRGAWQRLVEPYVGDAWDRQEFCCDQQGRDVTGGPRAVTLPSAEFFVLGDNRDVSLDSRTFGLVPRARLVGRVLVRCWPLDRAGPPASGLRLVPA